MVKRFTSIAIVSICFFQSNAQNYLDKYLSDPLTYTTIGTSADGLEIPRDLDFKPYTNELWVGCKSLTINSPMVIYHNAGLPNQSVLYRKDSHSSHFNANIAAFQFSNNGEWSNASELKTSTSNASSTFMGPSLWCGDTAQFANIFQSNWKSGFPLGSHLDMLHQSPYAMGIAWDTNRVWWLFDGYNGNICKYDFVNDHGPGFDYHNDGKIWRYVDVTVQRVVDVPSHMVIDKSTGWLYYISGASKQLKRLNTKTGSVTGNLTVPGSGSEPLAGYYKVQNVTVETIETFTTQPCGVEVYNSRLLVSDYTTGDIYIYDISGTSPVKLGKIATGQAGIMGIKVGPDGRIWFVNATQDKVVRINPNPATNDAGILRIVSPNNNNNDIIFFSEKFNLCDATVSPVVELINNGSNTLTSVTINYFLDNGSINIFNWTGSLAPNAVTNVTLPGIAVSSGGHKLKVYTSNPNGAADINPANNRKEAWFRAKNPVMTLPYTEGFSAAAFPPAGWSYINLNHNNKMTRAANVGGFGTNTGCVKMDNYSNQMDITGQRDILMTPRIDLTYASGTFEFSVAYAQATTTSNEKLELKISTDCGNTWTTLYSKSGSALSTRTPTGSSFTPTSTQWRKETVNISSYIGLPNVLFLFQTTSNFGNNIYIDDINIMGSATGITNYSAENTINVYPNPTSGQVTVSISNLNKETLSIQVFDILGNMIVETGKDDAAYIERILNLSSQAGGTYIVRIASEKNIQYKKIILEK